jgi:hypothetical protein
MTRHLDMCRARQEAVTGVVGRQTRPVRSFHLAVSGRHAPVYWMHIEAPTSTTLADLDDFLRDTWLECCGHLSAFTIRGITYTSSVDPEWGMGDRSMNVKLDRVMAVGDELHHKYDFGSTTYLRLKVLSEREGPARGRGIEILAQNEPPPIPCDVCGREATQICAECSWSGEAGFATSAATRTNAARRCSCRSSIRRVSVCVAIRGESGGSNSSSIRSHLEWSHQPDPR